MKNYLKWKVIQLATHWRVHELNILDNYITVENCPQAFLRYELHISKYLSLHITGGFITYVSMHACLCTYCIDAFHPLIHLINAHSWYFSELAISSINYLKPVRILFILILHYLYSSVRAKHHCNLGIYTLQYNEHFVTGHAKINHVSTN